MTWVADLSPAAIADYLVDSYDLDTRAHGAYSLIMMRYRLSGPLPLDEQRLAAIARCTRRMWASRIWPAIQHFFSVQDGFLRHADLDEARESSTDSRRSAAGRAGANARWGKLKLVSRDGVDPDAAADATGDAMAMRSHTIASKSHAQNAANSTVGASETHSGRMPIAPHVASLDASGASRGAGALPLSQQDSLSPESPNIQVDSGREGGVARAGADAIGDATADADGMRPHATASRPHRSAGARAVVPKVPITADWLPSEHSRREAVKRGYDPDEIAGHFRDHYIARGELRADWDAEFRNWVRRQAGFDGQHRQGHMTMAVPGGASGSAGAAPAASDPIEEDDPGSRVGSSSEARWARVRWALRKQIGAQEFRVWLGQASLISVDDEEVVLGLPSQFLRDRVSGHYADRLAILWRNEDPGIQRVSVEVVVADPRAASG